MEKEAIRLLYRQKRGALSYRQREEMVCQIYSLFFTSVPLTNCLATPNCLMGTYLPIERQHEVNTWPLIRHIWQHYPATRTCTPVPEPGTSRMLSVMFTAETVLTHTSRGIPVPPAPYDLSTQQPNLVLVPLLAFDRVGHRVGYGGGYYDRYLADTGHDCLKIGLSFFGPTPMLIPTEATDIGLNGCITPDHFYWFSEKNRA